MARIASYEFPVTFLQPMVTILTAAMVLAGVAVHGIATVPTADVLSVKPHMKMEPMPTGMTLPVVTSAPVAGGTATVPGSDVTLKPYGGGSILP